MNEIAQMFLADTLSFKWKDVQTTLLRIQYNRLMSVVIKDILDNPYKDRNGDYTPNYLNNNLCLTLDDCILYGDRVPIEPVLTSLVKRMDASKNTKIKAERSKIEALKTSSDPTVILRELEGLNTIETNFADSELKTVRGTIALQQYVANPDLDALCIDYYAIAELIQHILKPNFQYRRRVSLAPLRDEILVLRGATNPPANTSLFDFALNVSGLTNGAVLWLYFYERMGIFQILGALMDDYNYKGKFTISGKLKEPGSTQSNYPNLMDSICTLHRMGVGSNLRDRICTYQRTLGVTIENNLNIDSEKNTGFMQTFNKLISHMLEYYKAKQLADAIQSQNGSSQSRSSVATQTSIRDTMNMLRQQFEPMEYGRNQINTFIGIATVHATISLVRMLKDEIGIPRQYDRPEEFIPAAYDILVAKKSVTLNEANRFIIYDNCASYGYRLLTDIEMADLTQFKPASSSSSLDLWLDDVEGLVEGYRNAYSAVPERAEAIV